MSTLQHNLSRATGIKRFGPVSRNAIRIWERVAGSTYEKLWTTVLQVVDPIGELPRPGMIGAERTRDLRYYSEGKLRPRDQGCVFHFTLSGQGEFSDSHGTHILRPGMGFLVEVNDPTACYGYPRDQTETWEWIWLGFHGGAARMMLRDLVAREGGVYNLGVGHPFIHRLKTFHTTGLRTMQLSALDGMQIVLELFLALGQVAQESNRPPNNLLTRALHCMAQGDASRVKIDTLARELGVTREHLTRVFSREKGMGPQEYLLHQRIRHASQVLRESNLSVKEVAASMGFGSAANFIRAFRRIQGATPQVFRRSFGSIFSIQLGQLPKQARSRKKRKH